jgi:hypothetical protein
VSKPVQVAIAAAPGLPAFDLDDPHLPREIDAGALTSGGFPYHEKLANKAYARELELLQIELIKLHASLQKHRQRLLELFEGRDASSASWQISIRVVPRRWRLACRPRSRPDNAISSATCRICRPPVASFCLTARGTAAPASKG